MTALAALRHRPRPWTRRRHHSPHYECMNETDDRCVDEASDEPGVGHVCSCSCRKCSVLVDGDRFEVCCCRDCDARMCGLHTAFVQEGTR